MTEAERRAVRRAALSAIRNCGPWVTVGDLDEFVASAQRAEREVDRSIDTWQRWRRRFDPGPVNLETGSYRVNIRHSIALGALEQRAEAVRLLTGPEAGSA